MKIYNLPILLLLILFFIGCGDDNYTSNSDKALVPMQNSSQIDFKTVSNETISLQKIDDGFKYLNNNKTILINFFTTDCVPCSYMIPHLNNLQKKYNDNLTIISILLQSGLSQEKMDNYISENSIEYIVTFDVNNLRLSNEYGNITDIPSMFVYDKDGKLLTNYIGAIPEEMIEADLIRMF